MDTERSSGSGQPDRRPDAAPGARGSVWLTLVPVLCLVAMAAFWWQTRSELAAMRAQQRELVSALDAVRGVATIDVSGDPALGSDDTLVTLVEFSDYECPFCVRHFTQTMPEINDRFIATGRIQYVFKDFPIDQLHPGAMLAHQAARCAAEQGMFWEMHVKMFSPAGTHTPEALEAHAREAGVSIEPFRDCMASGRTVDEIRSSVQTAVNLGANGTPAFFIGLRDPQTHQVTVIQAISGAHPIAEFEKAIAAVEARP